MEITAIIIQEIDSQLARLHQARALLTDNKPSRNGVQPKRRSPEVRKHMAEAQRKRWAATKYSQKA